MDKNLKQLLKTYKEEFNIIPPSTNIDKILGIEKLNLQVYTWNPYLVKEEEFLRKELKNYLLEYQKQAYNHIITECVFQEYMNTYILVSYMNEGTSNNYTHILITIYDAYRNHLRTVKRALIKVYSKANTTRYTEYTKFKLVANAIYYKYSSRFLEMGLFPNKGNIQQAIYTQRFFCALNLINNLTSVLPPNIQGHHTFYETSIEDASRFTVLPIRKSKHTKEFHPNNNKSSAKDRTNIATQTATSEHLINEYIRNLQVSEAFYIPLSLLEVTLRNNICNAIETLIKKDWLLSESKTRHILEVKEHNKLLEAADSIEKQGKKVTNDRLVAEMTFGFWIHLCTKAYKPKLWDKKGFFELVFPNYNQNGLRQIAPIQNDLRTILRLRNRIFHHEIIINSKITPTTHYQILQNLLHLMSDDMVILLDNISRFDLVTKQKP